MKRLLMGMLGLLLAGTAVATGTDARKSVEGSMVVTGTIGVTPQGTVSAYTIDQPEKLPPLILDLIGKAVPRWTFQPVVREGKPVAAKASMSLRLVARPVGDGTFQIAVHSAYFGDGNDGIQKVKFALPRYPMQAARGRVEGTVYLVLRLDRTGKVVNLAVQQVNLGVIVGDDQMKHWRDVFAEATVKAAKEWTFSPADPSEKPLYRDIRIPVAYHLDYGRPLYTPVYGQWETYVPGPLEPVPWSDPDRMLTDGVDALPGDGIYGAPSLSLLTPLDRG